MKTFALTIHTNRILFFMLITLSLCASVFYAYGITNAIHNVAERQNLERELSIHTAHVSDLEFQYLALKNTVDLKMAESLGFATADTAYYVSRRTSVAYISLADPASSVR